jgi:hypothetical protein
MKDLILISAYCPDDYRENVLRDLVNSLTQFNDVYDIMIVSHTVVPTDIQKKVNYCFYDCKNEVLTDWDLLNQPWFNPGNDRRIQSSFLSKKNTHLAIWRMMILGFSLAKNMGYNKVHHIEYDCKITDDWEFCENSKLLDHYNCVVYIDDKKNVDKILFGSFQSYYLPNLNDFFISLDETKIKDMIRKSASKSPEGMLEKLLEENGKVFKKNRSVLENGGNYFGVLDSQVNDKFIPWAVPFYDKLENTIDFIVWNTKNENGVRHSIIINHEKVLTIDKTLFGHWQMIRLGHINEIYHILVIENDEVRSTFLLSTEDEKEVFKMSSFRHSEPY